MKNTMLGMVALLALVWGTALLPVAGTERTPNRTVRNQDTRDDAEIQSWQDFTNMVQEAKNWADFQTRAVAWGRAKKAAAEKAKKNAAAQAGTPARREEREQP